ncbi:MAG TPA: hypothetical protein VL049_10095 [Candidatus Dormibacteraeota bacterium]|nr:hypothetical protein [Candidatus Dormibacteraeota bacterium]
MPENNAGDNGTLGACGGSVPTATPTETPGPGPVCVGDCDGDGAVAINELIVMINIALGNASADSCTALCSDNTVDISCLISAVNDALGGCPPTA